MSILSELKRRNVFKVGAAYLIVAWVVIQVADTVAPQLGLPGWAPRFVTLLVLLGFPLALVLAWVFDITPDGIRADTSTPGSRGVITVGALLALAVFGWYGVRWRAEHRGAVDTQSIAVLPFVNMSGDPAKEYFSDGISEEILNVLARNPDLRVAARTSSFAFKGQNVEIPEIARALNVRMVLEGSVREQGDQVRITAQLIDATSGFHVWSETYDRDLKNIFAVQEEIAAAIGDELKVRTAGGTPRADSTMTVDPRAYDLYLRALALWRTRSGQDLLDAVEAMKQAIVVDPAFAKAYAGLAMIYAVIPYYTPRISYADAYRRGEDAAEVALALDPALPEAFAALGNIADSRNRSDAALTLLRRATLLNPSFASAWQWMGTNLGLSLGRVDEGLDALEKARTLDPRSAIVADNYATLLLVAKRYDEAIAVCAPVLAEDLDGFLCRGVDLMARLGKLGPTGARDALLAWGARAGPPAAREAEAVAAALEGHGDVQAVARKLAGAPLRGITDPAAGILFSTMETPTLLMLLGEPELAISYAQRAGVPDVGTPWWGLLMPALDPVRCDARLVAVMERFHVVDPRAAEVCGSG